MTDHLQEDNDNTPRPLGFGEPAGLRKSGPPNFAVAILYDYLVDRLPLLPHAGDATESVTPVSMLSVEITVGNESANSIRVLPKSNCNCSSKNAFKAGERAYAALANIAQG